MQLLSILGSFLLFIGCSHGQSSLSTAEKRQGPGDIRLARAQVMGLDGKPVRGEIQFEQMPNSVIVVYKVEGLQPKAKYQLMTLNGGDCSNLDFASADVLAQVRTNKEGMSEHTFKTVNYSVSGEEPLLGSPVVVVDLLQGAKQPLACGMISTFDSSSTTLQ